MGGLIGVATAEKNGFMSRNWFIYRGRIKINSFNDTTPLDVLDKCGFYEITPNPGMWGTLLIFYNGSGGAGGEIQFLSYIVGGESSFKMRMKKENNSSSWTPWKAI